MGVLKIYLFASEDILPIQERYTWFLEELFRDSVPEKKKARGKTSGRTDMRKIFGPICERWFLQEPGLTYNYCGQTAPGKAEQACRDIGSKASFRNKVKNNEVWRVHQRSYKAHR